MRLSEVLSNWLCRRTSLALPWCSTPTGSA